MADKNIFNINDFQDPNPSIQDNTLGIISPIPVVEEDQATDKEKAVKIKNNYKLENEANDDFWQRIKPIEGRFSETDYTPVTTIAGITKRSPALKTRHPIPGQNAKYFNQNGDPATEQEILKYEELSFINNVHSETLKVNDVSAGEVTIEDSGEPASMEKILKENKTSVEAYNQYENEEVDEEFEFTYEDYLNNRVEKQQEGFEIFIAKTSAPLTAAHQEEFDILAKNKAPLLYEQATAKYQDDINFIQSSLNKKYQKLVDNAENQDEVDELNEQFKVEFDNLIKPIEQKIQEEVSLNLKNDEDIIALDESFQTRFNTLQEKQWKAYAKDWSPKLKHFSQQQLNDIGKVLDANDFRYMNGPEKKAILTKVISYLERTGKNYPKGTKEQIKNEFWGYFYDKLDTVKNKDGETVLSPFILKDIASQSLNIARLKLEEETKKYKDIISAPSIREGVQTVTTAREQAYTANPELVKTIEYAEDVLNNPEFEKDGFAANFFAGLSSERFHKYIPVLGGVIDLHDANYLYKLTQKDNLTKEEEQVLHLYSIKNASEALTSDLSSAYNMGKGVAFMPGFIGEIYLTGGLFTGGKKIAKESIMKAAKKNVKKKVASKLDNIVKESAGRRIKKSAGQMVTESTQYKVADNVSGVIAFIAGTGAQTAANPQRYLTTMYENMTPEVAFAYTDKADDLIQKLDLQILVGSEDGLKDGQAMPEAFLKAFGTTWAEYATERMGELLPGAAKSVLAKVGITQSPDWLKRMSLGIYMRKLGLNKAEAFKHFTQKQLGWNGVFGEISEELINIPLSNLINGNDLSEGLDDFDSIYEMVGTIAITSFAFGTTNVAMNKMSGNVNPAVFVDGQRQADSESALQYLKRLKSEGNLNENTLIEVENDYIAFDQISSFLEKNGLDNKMIRTGGSDIDVGIITASEVDIYNEIDNPKERQRLEDIKEKSGELQEKLEELTRTKKSKREKGATILQIEEINKQLEALTAEKNKIISPFKDKIIKRKKNKRYQEQLGKLKLIYEKGNKGLNKDGTKILQEATSAKEVEEIVRRTILERSGILPSEVENLSPEDKRFIDKQVKEAVTSHGAFTVDPKTGNKLVLINKDAALEGMGINVAMHEFLHQFMYETLEGKPELKIALGESLTKYLTQIDPRQVRDTEFRNRLMTYQKDFGYTTSMEESLNLFSDAIANGTMQYNETVFTKIGDIFRKILQTFGVRVEFKTGRDVFNFIRDYNKAFEGGKGLNLGLTRTMDKGAKIGGDIKARSTSLKSQAEQLREKTGFEQVDLKSAADAGMLFSKEASDNVQRIYEDEGIGGAMDIIEAFKPITSRIVQKRSEAPNFDRELLTSEIELGKRGIFDLIREYNVDSGVPLAAYINKFLPARAIEASKRVLGEEFTTDITERVDVAAEEVTQQPTKPKKKKIVLADRLGVKSKVQTVVKQKLADINIEKLNFKTLKDQTPLITGEMFGISPKKLVSGANITKGELQSAQMFINKNADLLISMLPEGATKSGTATGVPNTLLKAFYTKADRAKMAKTGSKAGLAIQQKNNINKTDFLEVFGIVDGKPDRTDRNTSARVLALASLTGKMITNQTVREILIKDESSPKHVLSLLEDGKSEFMFSKETQMVGFNLRQDNIDIGNQLKDEQKSYKNILEDYGINHVNMNTPEGRKIFKQFWFSPDVMAMFPESFYNNSGTFTGTTKQKADGNRTYAGNYSFLNVNELKNAVKNAKENGGTFAKPDVDIANAVKKMSYSTIAKMSPAKQKAFNESKRRGLKKIWKIFEKMIQNKKNGGTNASMIAAMLASTSAYQGHFMRTASPVMFFNNMFGLNVEEHTAPASDLAKFLLNRAIQGNISEYYDGAVEGYFQGSLPKINDNMLKGTGVDGKKYDYTQNAPIEFMYDILLGKKPVWIRYFNPNVNANNGGINPNSLILLNGNSLAKEYGVDLDPDITTKEVINKQQELLFKIFNGDITELQAKKQINEYSKGVKSLGKNAKQIQDSKKINKSIVFSRSVNPAKGITVLDFDDTLATTKSLVKFTTPDGKTGTLNAEQFASTYEDLQDQGYTFDFSDFNKVVKGKLAPLFNKAIKLQGKFGPENMFVLTARPPQAQKAIFDFLKANGLNIPLKNITGLGNSTAEAKALWIADKVADGYNDFYFADDALQNVQAVKNMLDQFDVKSKVQQAKIKFSKDASGTFNDIIQETTGIESQKVFSEAQAKIRGQKSKYKSIIPPSAQDFAGLLYNFLGKGKKGEQDMAFFKKALIDPFARGINELNAARQASANDYENLLKQFPEVKKLLNKKIEGTDYTHDQAVRIYLWNKAGFEIPGLSKRDLNSVVDFVENNSKVQAFADTIGLISKKEDGYSAPGDYWLAENIKSDLLSDGSIGDARAEFLAEWQQNADLIFSSENLNKIEAIYGSNFREALEDILYRMKTGRNRPAGGGRLMNAYTNWVNNSVGAIMFLNMRSALLQTISATNYINWSDNNPLKAAAAFANQKQYWSDFSYLFNSDYLKQRRSGNQRGINEAELSAAVAGAENKAKAAIAWLLKKGFLPTQIADSFAISSGGATFYRNRIKAYIKQGMSKVDAEQKAFLDFQETTEVAQQSARPDMISQQQASPLGKLILAFQNTPMQYARIMNKAARDIYNGRGDMKTHTSKIIYYGFVQSIIFGALQSALFASLGDEDEEKFDKKKERILNGMIDSVLSGIGYGGKAVSTMKNTLITFLDQRKRGFNADHTYTILQLLGFSPPIGSKLRKVYSSIQTDKFNKDVFKRRGFTLDNPIWSAVGNVVEGVTNVPLGRFSQKMLNIDNALDANNKWWQRIALVLGWNTWDLGIKDADIEGIKKEIKKEKKVKAKEKTRIKREEKKKEKEEANKAVIEENKKKSKKDGLCSAVSKSGKRCKKKAINSGMCTIHEKAEQNESGKKTQCTRIKSSGKRCGMKTSSKSGLCYYHD